MRKLVCAAMAAILLGVPLLAGAADTSSPGMPKVGDMAPDFKLQYFDGGDLKDISLGQYRGKKNVILAFYIFAFTGG
jgi:hypothetical protein